MILVVHKILANNYHMILEPYNNNVDLNIFNNPSNVLLSMMMRGFNDYAYLIKNTS